MALSRNRFTNPANGAFYDWHINHDEEDEGGRRRAIEYTAPTSNIGLVQQQGDDPPIMLKYTGKILHAAQHAQFIAFFNLCRTQTIIFTDFAGDSYEVIITAYVPKRVRTLRNQNDPTIPFHYWTYTVEMSVVRVIAGTWVGSAA